MLFANVRSGHMGCHELFSEVSPTAPVFLATEKYKINGHLRLNKPKWDRYIDR